MFLFDTCFLSACFGLQNVTQTRDKYLCIPTVGKRFKIVFARKPYCTNGGCYWLCGQIQSSPCSSVSKPELSTVARALWVKRVEPPGTHINSFS